MIFPRLSIFLHFSPWPFQISFSVLGFVSSVVIFIKTGIFSLAVFQVFMMLSVVWIWMKDMNKEAEVGEYSFQVFDNLKLSFSLFVFSEIMFLVTFFWTFFHYSFSPSCWGALSWPPIGVFSISPLGLPLLNTILLISSGVTVTWGHHMLIAGGFKETNLALVLTIFLGSFFIINQGIELKEACFSVSDGIFGSIFFVLTGFHGFHVILGLFLLGIGVVRHMFWHFSSVVHISMELSIWYWHFVDCVWLLVYSLIYWWGG